MSLGHPQRVIYDCYCDCVERTKKKGTFSDDIIYFMLDTCSIAEQHGNRAYHLTASAVRLICERLCPGQWCTRRHCEHFSAHCAYNCGKTRPAVCKDYKTYIEKKKARKSNTEQL